MKIVSDREFDHLAPHAGRGAGRYAPYTDDFGSGSTGSWVRMLVGHTTVMRSPAFCITTGVERSFWPAIGVSGG